MNKMNKLTTYCERCGAVPGTRSACVGSFTAHSFTASTGSAYCNRCGAIPGTRSACVGSFTAHSFTASIGSAYCSRCGAVPGTRSACVGSFTAHEFVTPQSKSVVPNAIEQLDTASHNENFGHGSDQNILGKKDKNNSRMEVEGLSKGNDFTKFAILFLAADPSNASRLRLGEEYREISNKLRQSKERDRFQLVHPQLSARPEDISQAMLDTKPNIVHFSGHGTASGALCFENKIGEAFLVEPEALAALFEHFSHQVSYVLLNACFSEKQAKSIAKHIPYVIGMNREIGDKAAIAFAVGFYQAIGANQSIEDAYKLGCVQIRLQGIPEHETPVLIRKW